MKIYEFSASFADISALIIHSV